MLELARTFQRSLNRLTAAEQAEIKQVVVDYMTDPSRPGLSLHRLDRARDKRFWTIRASRDVRIVVFKDGPKSVFCYVGHHDDAYNWAEGRRFEVHPVTGAAQIVEIAEIVREEIRIVQREAPRRAIFAREKSDYLLSLGIPETYLEIVRNIDEDGLLDLCPRLPEEAQEALLELAAGNRPLPATIKAGAKVDPFEHPDAQRRFWAATDEEALAQALEKPWAEWLVYLHPSQRLAVDRNFNGPSRVSGSAGTGKSVVAMHRAANFARILQSGRIFLTTFSKTLAARLSDGMDTLLGPDSEARTRIEVAHLHGYAHSNVSRLEKPAVAADHIINQLIKESSNGLEPPFDTLFLRAEWDAVIDFWGIATFEQYRDTPRTGRNVALSERTRHRLWEVFAQVRRGLEARKLSTFGDVCDRLRKRIEADGIRPFHHVVVDEAQDLGPRELKLISTLALPGPQALFFAGDVGQKIFRWPFSWLAAGVDVRGRSQRLTVNYRTSAEICRFSDRLLPIKMTEVDGEQVERRAVSLLRGPEPELKGFVNTSQEIETLMAWISEIRKRGLTPGEIAIFARTRKALQERAEPALSKLGLSGAWLSPDQDVNSASITLGTLHSAKGLEFKAVAVIASDENQLPLAAALEAASDPEARRVIEERERNLLYVGCTRAREKLLVTWSGQPSKFIDFLRTE